MRISVFSNKELQGTILLLKNAPRDIAREIRGRTKAMILPAWQESVSAAATTPLQREVLANTARVSVSDQNVTLSVATVGKTLKGGGKPQDLWVGAEFGSTEHKQFGPRTSRGKVVFPSADKVIPRLASLWIQTTIRTFYELMERK